MTVPEKAFVNSFWGQKDDGFGVVQMRIKTSLRTIHELLEFYKEKISIEKEYNKKLSKLAGTMNLGSGEIGSLKIALDKLQNEAGNMVAQNQRFIQNISLQNYEKLHNFYQMYHKNSSKIETHMLRVLQKKKDYATHLANSKAKYRAACGQQKTLTLLCQTTWGKELEKNTAKLQKTQSGLHEAEAVYHQAVQNFNEIHEIWVRDWSISLSNIYQLEIERIQVCKLNCFAFCNHVAALCVEWDSAVDNARSTFAKITAPKDVCDFVDGYATGSQIPMPPKYIDFLGGFDDEDTQEYTVAEFKDPDYSQILSRTFSTHSTVVSKTQGSDNGSQGSANAASQNPGFSPAAQHATGNSMQRTPVKTNPALGKTLPPIQEPYSPVSGHNSASELEKGMAYNEDMRDMRDARDMRDIKESEVNQDDFHFNGTMQAGNQRQAHAFNQKPRQNFAQAPVSSNGHNPNYRIPPDSVDHNIQHIVPGSEDSHLQTPAPMTQKLGEALQKQPSHHSNYTSTTEDVFDRHPRMRNSNTSSDYSSPTNYSGQTGRSWSSPRKKSAHDVQKEINRRSQDLSELFAASPKKRNNAERTQTERTEAERTKAERRKSVPISKDFSIDFIAKALEDLNAGGDGDMNKFRRSVRLENKADVPKPRPISELIPASDYVDDSGETARRYDSITFRSPERAPMAKTSPARSGPRTVTDEESIKTVVKKPPPTANQAKRRSLSQSPTKSFTNLSKIVDKITPITRNRYLVKAMAKYTYAAREEGELSFKKGWHMFVIHKQEDNWYVCELGNNCGADRGSVGLVPYNYIVEGDNVF